MARLKYKEEYLKLKAGLERIHRETLSILLRDQIDTLLDRPLMSIGDANKWLKESKAREHGEAEELNKQGETYADNL